MSEVGQAVKVLDRDRFVVRKTTGWFVAGLVISVLGGAAFIGSSIFTREHQFDHLQEQVQELTLAFERVRAREQILERRLVEIETEIENLKERR